MKNINAKAVLPIVAAIIIFLVLTFGYFTPMLKGKVIEQSDMVQNKGMAKEVVDFRNKYHSEPLWTNSMFGGMPAYQISITYPANLITHVRKVFSLWLATPANMVFSYLLGFFILLLVLGVDKWLSIAGAIGFGFSAFLFLIIEAGHNTQALAIGYMAPVFAGVILVCRGRYLLGGAITALFMALELLCNHPQIAYYLVMFLMIYVIFEWVARVKQKQFMDIGKSLAVFVIAGVLAVGCNITNLWNTYDYAKYTIRGPSELTAASGKDKANQTTGLDKDYATQWSMGVSETMTLMIPGFKGRSSNIGITEDKNAMKELQGMNPDLAQKIAKEHGGQYWGDQPFTTSPYAGAIIIFLFVLGLFIVEGRMKWALLVITILSMALSWGKNMMWLTDIFFDHFPGYNKFRAVSMILVLAELAIPILAILAVDKLLKNPDIFKKNIKLALIKKEVSVQKIFIVSFILTGGLSLIYWLMPSSFTDFISARENMEIKDNNIFSSLQSIRETIFKGEAIRSFLFITAAAVVLWLYLKAIIKNKAIVIIALSILFIWDLAPVDKSYLNDKNFTSRTEALNPYPATTADDAILLDTDPDYRVLNIAVNTFNEASTSYYHKSIGGYHAAKLRRYQELIDAHIDGNIMNIKRAFGNQPTQASINEMLSHQGVLNMLNTRYIIYSGDAAPLRNPAALGNAWFVSNVKMAKNADDEIKSLGEIDVKTTAVVDERFKTQLDGYSPKSEVGGSIKLTSYKANDLTYECDAPAEQVAVFSEIYYKEGWNSYIDGQPKPYFACNYVLRGMVIPQGKHTIEFKFEPTKYYTAEKISLTSCLLLFAFVGGSLWMGFRVRN